ncbi:MAG: cell wall-active antibiotics response protein [Clostridiaceae bacterium]|jgi:predicted membrane protein|nr:cell wall-active antibiotics response protein [Clostridiaceae bacterium]
MKNMNISRILWGLALVVIGAIFALNALGLTDINIFFNGWWSLFIIIPSAIGLFSGQGKFVSLIGLVIGVAFLLSAQGILDFALLWKLMIPIIIILIGLKMIFGSSFNRKTSKRIQELKTDGTATAKDSVVFSSHKIDFNGQVFEGAVLDAVFGSITCDLRNAFIEKDCVITASAVFAGIDIQVPDYIQVKVNSNALFGGVSDKRMKKDQQDNAVTLYVDANCVFGGVDII